MVLPSLTMAAEQSSHELSMPKISIWSFDGSLRACRGIVFLIKSYHYVRYHDSYYISISSMRG